MREASVRRAEEQLKVSVAKLHAGSATRSDSLRSLVTLGSTQLDLIQARTDLATAEAGLARLVGQTGRVRAVDDSAFTQVVATVDTAAHPAGGRGAVAPDPDRRGQHQGRPGEPPRLPRRLLAQPHARRRHRLERQPAAPATPSSTSGR